MKVQEIGERSAQLSREASRYISGGAASLNRKVVPDIVFSTGKGCRIVDVEGNEYIDYHAAFGPHLLGHNNDLVNEAVLETIRESRSLIGSGTNELEIHLARLLCDSVPSLEQIQIVNTGSEAVSHAIRLSRAFTGREDIILMLGGYNGWNDDVCRAVMPSLKQVGKRVSREEYPFIPNSAGIPEANRRKVHIVNFNDLESVETILNRYPIACVLTEPVLQNVGVILPGPGYLKGLVSLCEAHGTVCIFDEVKTGFRSALGGYQSVAEVRPHLSVFGKAVANGYPLGVIGGRTDIMQLFNHPDPAKRVLIAGTYNAHPVNTAAAIATLEILKNPEVYRQIERMSNRLYSGLKEIFGDRGIQVAISSNASAFCVYFAGHCPGDLHDLLENVDFLLDMKYRRSLIRNGIYHIPVACKQGSVSYAHTENDIDLTLAATREALKSI